ncbi:MAG: DUF3592 domain-containing protein [Gemmatimonadetes bacterium]|nr:DUF3592 domain-containing protein [Gemmatimonadota bacterium]
MSAKPGLSHLGGLTIALYVAGLGALGFAGWTVWGSAKRLSEWPEVSAAIKARRVIGDPKGYRGEVDFAYAEQGIKYVSSAHDTVVTSTPGEALARLQEWPVGATRTVRYNPTDPSEVDMDARDAVSRFIAPGAGVLAGLVLIVFAIVRTSETFDEIRAASVAPEPLPEGGPLPDVDWIARATEAAEKRRQEAVVAKKSNAKLRKQVRRVRVGALALGATGLALWGAGWWVARPELEQRNAWQRADATSVGVSVVDVERAGKTQYSVDALMALERSATGSAVLVSAGAWYADRAKAEADSAKVEYGSAHQVVLDPKEPFRARLAETMTWKDFGWPIAFAVLGLLALASGGWVFREGQAIKAAGERKLKSLGPKTAFPTPPKPIDLDFKGH